MVLAPELVHWEAVRAATAPTAAGILHAGNEGEAAEQSSNRNGNGGGR